MCMTVPARISVRIGEAKIGREVDDFYGRRLCQQILDHRLRGAMRQRAEHEIKAECRPVDAVERDQRRQGKRRELREHVRHWLARPAIGREQRDVDARMPEKQPHQFRAGITRRAEDADFCFRRHDANLWLLEVSQRPRQDIRKGYQGSAAETGGTSLLRAKRAPVPCHDGGAARRQSATRVRRTGGSWAAI